MRLTSTAIAQLNLTHPRKSSRWRDFRDKGVRLCDGAHEHEEDWHWAFKLVPRYQNHSQRKVWIHALREDPAGPFVRRLSEELSKAIDAEIMQNILRRKNVTIDFSTYRNETE